MYALPTTAEVKKQLPKKAIYAKFDMSPSQRESFDADIARIDIVTIISPRTLPALAEGEEVKEFYVLAIRLKKKEYVAKNIVLLTNLIHQKMVFALHYEEEVQFAIYHTKLVTSEWQTSEEASLPLLGLNLDAVWENIVTYIGQIKIADGNSLVEQIKVEELRAKLKVQINSLTQKLNKEKQFNRQIEINSEIKLLKKKLLNLK